jgi:hypothetical protein
VHPELKKGIKTLYDFNETLAQYINEIYSELVCYFFGSRDRRDTEEIPNKYRRNTEQMKKGVREKFIAILGGQEYR